MGLSEGTTIYRQIHLLKFPPYPFLHGSSLAPNRTSLITPPPIGHTKFTEIKYGKKKLRFNIQLKIFFICILISLLDRFIIIHFEVTDHFRPAQAQFPL